MNEQVTSHQFYAHLFGERFDCEVTWMASPAGIRWTVVAKGNRSHQPGIIRTGLTATGPATPSMEEAIERDMCADIRATLALEQLRASTGDGEREASPRPKSNILSGPPGAKHE